ncbi:MAG: beta-galactosidase, partial [Sandaracinaceae bacterium]
MAKGPTGRRRRGRRVGVPRVEGSCLHLGERDIPLYSGAVHYWRLDPSRWRPALTQLRALGLPMVETYVPWQVHERAPGIYDFGDHEPAKDLGAFLDLAASLDLAVFLRPGPHINAEMTFFGLPERVVYDRACQARSPKQNAVLQGFPPRFFPVPSYASDTFHDECARYFRALGEVVAPRLWPAGPVALLQIDNEGAYYFRDGAYDQDYHPDAALRWRAFLRERYGSLEAAREVHRASYRSWEEVEPPVRFAATEPGELVVHLDWAAFREVLVTEALSRFGQSMKAAGLAGVPTVHNLPLGDQGMSVSPPQIETVVDIVGFDYYHGRREHRTIKRRTLYLAGTHDLAYAPELGIGAPPWFSPLSSEDSLFTVQSALAYGLRGFNLNMAVDRDRWYGAPIDAQGTPRIEAGVWKQLVDALRSLRFHELERRADVALMVPREYGRLSRATHLL